MRIILKSGVEDGEVMQNLELASQTTGGEHSQRVKAPPVVCDYGSRDCVKLASSTADFRIIAHRGASAEAPENSLVAIERAILLGCDAIEIDVHLSKDHVPVVIHDCTLDRTFGLNKRVYDCLWKDLKGYVPSLHEVLNLDRKGAELMIELKPGDGPPKILAHKVLELVRGHKGIILGSFSLEILREIRKAHPSQRVIGIMDHLHEIHHFRDLGIQHFALHKKLIDAALTKHFHPENESVWVFTVDDPEHGKNLFSFGVKGIISNNPRSFYEPGTFR